MGDEREGPVRGAREGLGERERRGLEAKVKLWRADEEGRGGEGEVDRKRRTGVKGESERSERGYGGWMMVEAGGMEAVWSGGEPWGVRGWRGWGRGVRSCRFTAATIWE